MPGQPSSGRNQSVPRATPAIPIAIKKCGNSPTNSGALNSTTDTASRYKRRKVALDELKLPPDFEATGNRPQIAYKHRSTPEAEIYFVSNQKYYPRR